MKKHHDTEQSENDIVIEEEFTEDSGVAQNYTKKINSLKDKLEKCQSEKQEYLDGWQRVQADFINFKKNNDSLFKQAKESATIDVVEALLPALDSFEMALSGTFDETFKKWLTGFEYVHTQLKKVLEEYSVTEINPINESFSTASQEAIGEIETDDESLDDIVAQVILKGYQTQKRIIRAAQVKVYKYTK